MAVSSVYNTWIWGVLGANFDCHMLLSGSIHRDAQSPRSSIDTSGYFAEHKRMIVGLLLAAEMLVNFTYFDYFVQAWRDDPGLFWSILVPYNVAISLTFAGLFFFKSRRIVILLLIAILALLLIPYWQDRV